MTNKSSLKFIDLFAGLGGFHVALKALGHECVFASEIDEKLSALYHSNFGIRPSGDIRKTELAEIPAFDVLCAGFPCQPFSKAGEQEGFLCTEQGDLFWYVSRIIDHHKPTFVILENVPNIFRHDSGKTYETIKSTIANIGYQVTEAKLSPHQFGIPQVRERAYIVARRSPLDIKSFYWPEPETKVPDIRPLLDKNPKDAKPLPPRLLDCLKVWQSFLDEYPSKEELPSYPIWSMEFSATYPYEDTTPARMSPRSLGKYLGCHGLPLSYIPESERFSALPSHARTDQDEFPDWKVDFIRKNRELYLENWAWIDRWMPEILQFPPSLQKFEWNCKGEERNLWNLVLQVRASGVRVKRATSAPSLIAMTTTQVPIVAWEKRYMTPRECARLQNLESLTNLPPTSGAAYKALGNAVNTEVIRKIAAALVN